jgi:hypothetical protein
MDLSVWKANMHILMVVGYPHTGTHLELCLLEALERWLPVNTTTSVTVPTNRPSNGAGYVTENTLEVKNDLFNGSGMIKRVMGISSTRDAKIIIITALSVSHGDTPRACVDRGCDVSA